MILGYFYEVSKKSWFFDYFHQVCIFLSNLFKVNKISCLSIFMTLAKFYNICKILCLPILWSLQNFMIFGYFYLVCKTSWFLAIFMKLVIGKKIRVSSIFDSRWRNEASNFHLRKFGKVEPFWEHCGPDVDINTKNSLDNSGSNETAKGSSFDSLALAAFSKKMWGRKF